MSHAEIHAELRGMRPWLLLMGIVALVLLSCWLVFGTLGTLAMLNPEVTGDWTSYMSGLLLGLAVQLALIALGALIPFVNLVRMALLIGRLDESNPSTLRGALELSRTFWRQAEWLAWAATWLIAYYLVGAIVGVATGLMTPG